ncbi:MAG: formylmethanofuran dehydrogenase [Candidatus Lokiarchaeota archaeon]|nr:formylmethanofuran dehydrogenase [Candidatus Lokiarchaeota archaeon]
MDKKSKYEEYYDFAVKFHGHSCPGMLSGLLMSIYVLENFNVNRAMDEELVTISEGTSCMVDSFQAVLGTTLGKGNLLIKDYGKNAAVFLNRNTEKGIRLSFNYLKMREILGLEDLRPQLQNLTPNERSEFIKNLYFRLLEKPLNNFIDVEKINMTFPDEAHIFQTIICESCGEGVMETRIRVKDGRKLCISCAEGKYWKK